MESPGDLEWDMAPWVAELLVAVAEDVGMEKMGELAQMFIGAVVRQNSTIVRERKGGM